jgi:hypothetical protein
MRFPTWQVFTKKWKLSSIEIVADFHIKPDLLYDHLSKRHNQMYMYILYDTCSYEKSSRNFKLSL